MPHKDPSVGKIPDAELLCRRAGREFKTVREERIQRMAVLHHVARFGLWRNSSAVRREKIADAVVNLAAKVRPAVERNAGQTRWQDLPARCCEQGVGDNGLELRLTVNRSEPLEDKAAVTSRSRDRADGYQEVTINEIVIGSRVGCHRRWRPKNRITKPPHTGPSLP